MAKKLPLILLPDPILRKKGALISASAITTPTIQTLILDMEKTMQENKGIGLAAPQVGQSVQLAIIKTQDGVMILINPVLSKRSLTKEIMEEGCLSIPGVYGLVKRPKTVTVSALDATGKRTKFIARGLMARVIQHEVDHLNGILFIDKTQTIVEGAALLKTMEGKKHND